jgi:hypothetical protein
MMPDGVLHAVPMVDALVRRRSGDGAGAHDGGADQNDERLPDPEPFFCALSPGPRRRPKRHLDPLIPQKHSIMPALPLSLLSP